MIPEYAIKTKLRNMNRDFMATILPLMMELSLRRSPDQLMVKHYIRDRGYIRFEIITFCQYSQIS